MNNDSDNIDLLIKNINNDIQKSLQTNLKVYLKQKNENNNIVESLKTILFNLPEFTILNKKYTKLLDDYTKLKKDYTLLLEKSDNIVEASNESNVKNIHLKIDNNFNTETNEHYYNNIVQSKLDNTNNIEINKHQEEEQNEPVEEEEEEGEEEEEEEEEEQEEQGEEEEEEEEEEEVEEEDHAISKLPTKEADRVISNSPSEEEEEEEEGPQAYRAKDTNKLMEVATRNGEVIEEKTEKDLEENKNYQQLDIDDNKPVKTLLIGDNINNENLKKIKTLILYIKKHNNNLNDKIIFNDDTETKEVFFNYIRLFDSSITHEIRGGGGVLDRVNTFFKNLTTNTPKQNIEKSFEIMATDLINENVDKTEIENNIVYHFINIFFNFNENTKNELIIDFNKYNKFIKPNISSSYVTNNEFINNSLKDENNEDVLIIFFKTEWCPHCKKAMPEWNEFTNYVDKLNDKNDYVIRHSIIDCDKQEKIAEKYNIEAYPSIILLYKK